VTLPGSGGTVGFKYDPFGRDLYNSSSSGTSICAYDQENLVEATNARGSAVARYGHFVLPMGIFRGGYLCSMA